MDNTTLGAASRQGSKAGSSGTASREQRKREDVNFSSIMSLDSAGGWHILKVSADGQLVADAVSLKVLRQFFPDGADWVDGIPRPLATAFFECRQWGLQRALTRTSGSLAFVRLGAKLAVHFIPDAEGAYILMKTGHMAKPVDLSAWPLTSREKEIATLVAAGKTNVEIGLVLEISMRTVQKHLENMFRKLGVETRMALAMRLSA